MSDRRTYRPKQAFTAVLITESIFWAVVLLFYFWVMPSFPELKLQRGELWWALLICTGLSLLFYLGILAKKRALNRFADRPLIGRMAPSISTSMQVLKFVLWRIGLALIVVAVINPRFGKKLTEVKYQGIDMMICLDVSNSMLAEDLKPNRLRKAKRAISQLVGELNGDRVGLIVFAGDAYVQLPITTDYAAAQMFLSSVDNTMVPTQGTAIGRAIDLAAESFKGEKQEGSRAIVVITDGENHEDDAIDAAARAVEQGITVHTIGMGSEEGAPIPLYVRRTRQGYKKDNEGKTIISKLNEAMLSEVSAAGEGVFVRATNADVGLDLLIDEIQAMDKIEFGTEEYADYEDRYQLFLLPAILLLVIEFVLFGRRMTIDKRKWIDQG